MSKTVVIGEGEDRREYTIQRFRGLKAILAIAALSRVAKAVPDIMADAVKEYQNRNTVRITEAMSKLPRWAGFSKEDFDAAEVATGERIIELPMPMDQNEQLLQALPSLLDEARREVVRLLAILIIPNSELKIADKDDKVDEALDQYQDVLLYNAELDQLAELLIAASDVLSDQLADRKERLGKVAEPLMKFLRRNSRTPLLPSMPQTSQIPSPPNESESTSTTSSSSAPSSSTDSPQPTDGIETPSSMESLGVS